ncbi:MAG: phytanoyl-CoA dioxygenase family protein [Candidatus Latescibacteria bacterium]|nr:phytanoyl-CoA dioxygenase family protein [Candidatus Latescibacterota bacterium]
MLTGEQVDAFNQRGFVNIGPVCDEATCQRLKDEFERVMRGEGQGEPVLNRNLTNQENRVVVQIVNIWQASPAFLQHAAHARITAAVAQLCQSDALRVWHDQIQYKPPGHGGATHWHQDHPAWPIIEPADLISAWVPFADATVDNGCMWMVPGSHRWGNQQGLVHPNSEDDFTPQHTDPTRLPANVDLTPVPVEVRRGECSLHHSLTWHGSPQNRSSRARPAIAVHYMPAHTRYVDRGDHPMKDYVEVEPGALLQGASFPLVYQQP